MDLQGKTVVIVGGGAGIGRAGGLALARAGCNVVVADIDEVAAQDTARDIEAIGSRALVVRCDAAVGSDMEILAERATAGFEQVDILWIHAGGTVAGPPERIPLQKWRDLLELNVLGGVRGLHAFLPAMLERGAGHLVFTSSGLGLFPDDIPGLAAPYVITKAAQVALARTLAPYLAPHGVGVSLLAPDLTATRHAFEVPTVDLDPAILAAALDPERMHQPEDVGRLLVEGLGSDTFLISAVPHTRERLVEAASALSGRPSERQPIVQYVRMTAHTDRHDTLASVLADAARSVRTEPGAAMYEVSADAERRGVFHVLEEWDSPADLERHAATPGSQALLARMPEFGIEELEVRRYSVANVDESVIGSPGPQTNGRSNP